MNFKSLPDLLEWIDTGRCKLTQRTAEGIAVVHQLYDDLEAAVENAKWLKHYSEIKHQCYMYNIYETIKMLYNQITLLATHLAEHPDDATDYSGKLTELVHIIGLARKLELYGKVIRETAGDIEYQLKYGRAKAAGLEQPDDMDELVWPIFYAWYKDHNQCEEIYRDMRMTAHTKYYDDTTFETMSEWISAGIKCDNHIDLKYNPIADTKTREHANE